MSKEGFEETDEMNKNIALSKAYNKISNLKTCIVVSFSGLERTLSDTGYH